MTKTIKILLKGLSYFHVANSTKKYLNKHRDVLALDMDSDNMLKVHHVSQSQRVLEADAAEDAFNDDDDFEVDTPKRRHRGKGRVRNHNYR